MPELKWTSPAPTKAGHEYVVFASQLPAASLGSVPAFMRRTMQISKQLQETSGLVAYSLRADVLKHRFWTLSVWEDEASLHAFVRREPHASTMRALSQHTRDATFASWRTFAPLPLPSWEEVSRRLAEAKVAA